uniref:Uncharacterized protein n=1 Tax=Solanum lycopersicum TaxID=4081 RepID=K4BH03_SOLLC
MGLIVLAKKGERRSLGGLRALAFRILLNGCGSGTQVLSRQVRHSVHEPETYLHSKLLNLTRSVMLLTSPPASLRPHEDDSTSLGRRGAADSTPPLSSCTWYNKKRNSRNGKVFSYTSALIPPKAK